MTVKEMKARLRAINAEAAKTTDPEALNALLAEAEELNGKIEEAANRARLQHLADGAGEEPEGNPAGGEGSGGESGTVYL